MNSDEAYMFRCLQLAKLGAGMVAPNPMVGAVLVYENNIIGEGYHKQFGGAHAEVNCIQNVPEHHKTLIEKATLYVSLEPCAHFGKTPPCSDLIITNRIRTVVIGCRDPFDEVNGKGIEKLRHAGVQVHVGVLEHQCIELNKRFFTFHVNRRPYIILKWACSFNNKLAGEKGKRLVITNEITNRLVHRWRTEEAAIMVGTNTALFDDPLLNTRKWPGPAPIRLVADMHLRLPDTLRIFDRTQPTIIFNKFKHVQSENLQYYQVMEDVSLVDQVLNACMQLNIQSILVEGGNRLLQSFIDEDLWDEARVLTNTNLLIEDGVAAPELRHANRAGSQQLSGDTLHYYHRANGNVAETGA